MKTIRLNRYLASCGLGSRRHCDDLITAQRVRVNGDMGVLGTRVTPQDRVEFDGKEIQPQTAGQTWMFHKPKGVLTASSDPRGRLTVQDCLILEGKRNRRAPQADLRLFPVGRLDYNTTGLLLLTNDGDLGHRLTHPSWKIDKEYEALVAQALSPQDLLQLQSGLELEDGPTAPCEAKMTPHQEFYQVRLVLREGRKRQVRRMLQSLGHPVLELHRRRIGSFLLGNLGVGRMRPLSEIERRELYLSVGLVPDAMMSHTTQQPDKKDRT